jgi:formate--tetrahydrofolate ligase
VVAVNRFPTDTDKEVELVIEKCRALGVNVVLSDVWAKGGEGGIELANCILDTLEKKPSDFHVLYDDSLSLCEKIETVAKEIYGAATVTYDAAALKAIAKIEELGYKNVPVCMAKNQYSLSDDPKKLGRPEGFTVNIREAYISAGAGFLVAITGTMMTMPGLPKVPAAEGIDVVDGSITGLF